MLHAILRGLNSNQLSGTLRQPLAGQFLSKNNKLVGAWFFLWFLTSWNG